MGILKDYIEHWFTPFAKNLPKSQASYQHLEFAGCGSISIGSSNIGKILKHRYPKVFTKGFSEEQFENEIGEIINSGEFLTPCLRNKNLFQFKATDFEYLKNISKAKGIKETEYSKSEAFWKKYLMSEKEIKEDLIQMNGDMATIYDVWENSPMKNMTLTSVGIAIAHAYTRSKIGDSGDLSIWIN